MISVSLYVRELDVMVHLTNPAVPTLTEIVVSFPWVAPVTPLAVTRAGPAGEMVQARVTLTAFSLTSGGTRTGYGFGWGMIGPDPVPPAPPAPETSGSGSGVDFSPVKLPDSGLNVPTWTVAVGVGIGNNA